MDYSRRENESILNYAERLIENRNLKIYDIEKTEIYQLLIGEEVSPDHARKCLSFIEKLIEKYKDEEVKDIKEEDILKEIELQKQELKKEKIKIQTENLSLNQRLREEARYEFMVEKAIDTIKTLPPLNIPNFTIEKSHKNRSGVLIFADCHYGKVLEIKSLTGQIMNEYSPEIFEKRMWSLLEQTVKICKDKNFNHISIFNLGDELEGLIRVSQLFSLKYGVIDSSILFSRFISNWLNELSRYEIAIDYFSTYGNHTDLRLLTNKKGDFPHENISKFINAFIKSEVRDNKNIKIIENVTDKIYTNVEGYDILGIHGEEKDPQKAIRDFNFLYPENVDYVLGGHKHHVNVVNCGFRKGFIGVGSIIGIDDYSMSLKKTSDPNASFVIFEKGNGKVEEITMPLD